MKSKMLRLEKLEKRARNSGLITIDESGRTPRDTTWFLYPELAGKTVTQSFLEKNILCAKWVKT